MPLHETVIYETHVKGFTMRHPDVREDLRGTYAGPGRPRGARVPQELGVTAVELLPVHHIADESFLAERGLTNYWGYSTIGFFAPFSSYAATGIRGQEVREFKGMVKALHRAGIEVILDVVYNHTAEGNHLGPMLSFKGVDNASYYRLMPDDPHHYMDFTGTGNSLNPVHPSVLRLIMDSLRYWVTECHVDGFRFDLASALARELYDVDRLSAFFDTIHQDPVLTQVKLIAEPWDVGPGGYQVGNFPVLWSEWNGMYRDVMRDFWRGQASVADFASRLTGSSDLYESDGRHPFASINFITAHDGFTLRDLVSYNEKHNEANLEDNRDGTDDNRSWNCGAEGPTDDPAINALRARQQRNFLATLLLSQGTPMLLGGDEFGRSQGGNNNAWCQDSEISWFDWDAVEATASCSSSRARLIALRHEHPVFRRRQFLHGTDEEGSGLPDVWWFRPDGRRMTKADWDDGGTRLLGMFLNGEEIVDAGRARAADRRRLLRAAVQRRPRGRGVHAAAAALRRRVDVRAAHGRRAGRRNLRAPARPCRCCSRSLVLLRRTRRHDASCAPPTGCSSAAASASRRRASSCPTCATSGSATSTCRRRSRRARAPRTATTSSTRPRSRRSSAASASSRRSRARCARPGMGLILDIVPNHMATDDANRYWSDPDAAAALLRPRRGDRPAPALLRHRPPRRACARRTRRSSRRRTGSRWRSCATATVDGLRIDHPDGLADPAGYLRRLREGGARHVWVEKILDPGEHLRDWPVEGTVGYEFLNDVAALFVDPAGEAPLTALWEELSGDRAAVRRATPTRPSSSRRARRSRPRSTACAARRRARSAGSSARSPRCRSTAPTSSRGRARVDGRGPRGDRGGRAAGVAGARAAPGGARLGRVRDPLPADDAAGDGQGRRGHGVLPLPAAAGAQRRRRRPRPLRASRSSSSTRQRRARASASRATCSSPRRTTRSARATCGRGSARCRRCPSEWAERVRRWLELTRRHSARA